MRDDKFRAIKAQLDNIELDDRSDLERAFRMINEARELLKMARPPIADDNTVTQWIVRRENFSKDWP